MQGKRKKSVPPLERKKSMRELKTRLSVNVNKIATLRNARGGDIPNVTEMTRRLIESGAQGITIHPRPDERHIRRRDVYDLKDLLKKYSGRVEYNIEGYPSENFLKLMKDILPDQCTLVPDPPDVLTSNAGWRLTENKTLLKSAIRRLKALSIRTSLFIDPFSLTETELSTLRGLSPDRVELYTEQYASIWNTPQQKAVLAVYQKAARRVKILGIGINAGHDLNQQNLPDLLRAVPEIREVSIGQAFIAESLKEGMAGVLKSYLRRVQAKHRPQKDESDFLGPPRVPSVETDEGC